MTPSRRAILAGLPLLALTACPSGTGTSTPSPVSQLITWATIALNAAQDVLAAVGAGLPPNVTSAINQVISAANAVISGLPAGTASWPQVLYDGLKALLALATTPPLSALVSTVPGVGLALGAMQVLLPLLAGLLGVTALAPPPVKGVPLLTYDRALQIYGAKK